MQILDVLDCTGSGDVNVTSKAQAVDGVIKGANGNDLKLNPDWVNPSGVPVGTPIMTRLSQQAHLSEIKQ